MNLLHDNMTILFQGDSITDCSRDRGDPGSLGNGYVAAVAEWLSRHFPGVKVLNRGVSGDRALDLMERWQRDCLDLRPDLLTLYVGINDTWRRYDRNDPTPAEVFEARYWELLARTREVLGIPVILMEPFLLETPPDRRAWREDLDPKIHVIRRLAREFGCRYVPLDGLFAAACCLAPPETWAPDGIHPSPEGAKLIAGAWLDVAV